MPEQMSSSQSVGRFGSPALDTMDPLEEGTKGLGADTDEALLQLLAHRADLLAELDRTGVRIQKLLGTPDPMDPAFTQALLDHCHRAKRKAIAAQSE